MKNNTPVVLSLIVVILPLLCTDVFAKKQKQEPKIKKTSEVAPIDKVFINDSLGYTAPYVPVLLPPMVKKVWVPAHVLESDPDVMIGGHWIFLKVTDDKWFIDTVSPGDMTFPVVVPTAEENKQ